MSMAKAQAVILNWESANVLCKSQTACILGAASATAHVIPTSPATEPQSTQGQCVNE